MTKFNQIIEKGVWGEPLPDTDPLAEKGHITRVMHIPEKVIRVRAKMGEDAKIYLSHFLYELPKGVFHKGAMGVGGTTLALQSEKNCILCFPTRNLVENKMVIRDEETHEIIGERNDYLCVFGGKNDTPSALFDYIDERESQGLPVKICCTYDQCEKIVMWMRGFVEYKGKDGRITWKETDQHCYALSMYDLLIDEIHQAWFIYGDANRRKRIQGMMRCIKYFDGGRNVTCMTATPIKDLAWFKELDDFPVYKIIGYGDTSPNIIKSEHPRLETDCGKKVLDFLEGREGANANLHVFVNSVNFIARVLKRVNLAKYGSQIKVVCSDADRLGVRINFDKIKNVAEKQFWRVIVDYESVKFGNRKKNKKEIEEAEQRLKTANYELSGWVGDSNPISPINTPPKKINFYTATAWAGCDIFDKNGITLVIADGTKQYTIFDLGTTYQQILGRIRDSRSPVSYFWYNSTNRYLSGGGYGNADEDEERKEAQKTLLNGSRGSNLILNTLNPEQRDVFYIGMNDETGTWEVDENLEKLDKMQDQIYHSQWATPVNISAAMIQAGLKVQDELVIDNNIGYQLGRQSNKRTTFKKRFLGYCELKSETIPNLFKDVRAEYACETIEAHDPIIKPAYELLGAQRVKELKYNAVAVEREVNKVLNQRMHQRIIRAFRLKVGDALTPDQWRERCKRVTAELSLSKMVKRDDVFELKRTSIRSKDDPTKTINVYQIIGVKTAENNEI